MIHTVDLLSSSIQKRRRNARTRLAKLKNVKDSRINNIALNKLTSYNILHKCWGKKHADTFENQLT